MEWTPPRRRRGSRRKGEKPVPLSLAPIGLMRLFETDDIEVAIGALNALGVWCQARRGSRTWAYCVVDALPDEMRERAAAIALDEDRRNTALGRLNDDGTFSPSHR
jgi:hypothetical protein